MALNKENNNKVENNPKTIFKDQETQEIPTQNANRNVSGSWQWLGQDLSVLQMGGLNSAAILREINKVFNQVIEEYLINKDIHLDFILLDRDTVADVFVSSVIVVMRLGNKASSPVAYHSLLIEDSIEPLSSRVENFNGKQIEIQSFTQEAYDKRFVDVVESIVRKQYNDTNVWLNACGQVIPRGTDFSDLEVARRILLEAILACRLEFDNIVTNNKNNELGIYKPAFNLAFNDDKKSRLRQTIFIDNRATIKDTYNLPVRSDIKIDITASMDDNPATAFRTDQQNISTVTGFIDLQFSPEEEISNSPWSRTQKEPKLYQPVFVITQMLNSKSQTLPATLFNLIGIQLMLANRNWYEALRPYQNGKQNELHDIGNIGYDIPLLDNVHQAIDTSPQNFTDEDLIALISSKFRDGLAVALDIPVWGSLTWMYRTLAEAAFGDNQALSEIATAADILTNGHFSANYKGSHNYVYSVNDDRTLLGYYTDANGQVRDLRDIDYLAICGIMKNDQKVIVDWTDSYSRTDITTEEKLFVRKRLIDHSLGGAVHYTGLAARVVFEPQFLEALATAVYQCGTRIIPSVTTSGNYTYTRSNSGYSNYAITNVAGSGIFSNSYSNRSGFANSNYRGGWGFR